ncbi:hypothetical protein GEV33_013147 [Tenebrio molitor]|uniref:Uncharacterized protein n=1 Tax=Tenebrio molitor TaxID=7067 RepID=A0A8J6L6Q4_TENMO|nr:hypothetical protein GEV33_013147 [Tenebrio molitor]
MMEQFIANSFGVLRSSTVVAKRGTFARMSHHGVPPFLTKFYNHRRVLLKVLNEENFSSSQSVLFIYTLIDREFGGKLLQEQRRNDGGNGLYPPPSLQALLTTYVFDLANTLDQEHSKPITIHLTKFPAVFKNHCDYNTAMVFLLDPLISPEDLSHWHHNVALRSLILQKQHNFCCTFKSDNEEILTAISLYVVNNMLHETFYQPRVISVDQDEGKLCSRRFQIQTERSDVSLFRVVLRRLILRPWFRGNCGRCWFSERRKVHTCPFQALAHFDGTREERREKRRPLKKDPFME